MTMTMRKRTPLQIEKAVLFALIMRELKTRFGGRLIGLFWVLFEPVMTIYTLLFIRSVMRARYLGPTIDYPVYHVCAMIPFFVFRSCWFRTMEAVTGNIGLFSYRQVKPFDAMIARITLEGWIYAFVYLCVLGTLLWFGMKFIPDDPLTFLACWATQLALGFGFGSVSLVISHGKPHVKMILHLLVTPIYLLSGILIPLATFPPSVQYWLMFNPCAHLVEVERVAYYHEYIPIPGTNFEYPIMWALSSCALGQVLYRLYRLKLLRK